MGYEVVGSASSGEEAIEMVRNLIPDLVLMDIVMPGVLDGIEAAEIIKAELDIPVLFLTAYSNDDLIQRAKNTGAFGYIMKPFQENEIKANIEIALSKKNIEMMLRDSANQINSSLKEKDILMREIHHQVKNHMQMVSSLIRFQENYIEDEQLLKIFKEIKNRVRTMGLIHEKLYQSENCLSINFAEYTRELANSLFTAYSVNKDLIRMNIDIDDILLEMDTAIPCGLIINELLSNSLKHAFPEGREGEVSVELTEDDSKLTLIVSNNGVSFPKDLDFRSTDSLGLQLVNMLTEQIKGTIELDRSSGTVFKITFKLS
jgi:two-component sensor histidine kinase